MVRHTANVVHAIVAEPVSEIVRSAVGMKSWLIEETGLNTARCLKSKLPSLGDIAIAVVHSRS